jgi:hypothetical protein
LSTNSAGGNFGHVGGFGGGQFGGGHFAGGNFGHMGGFGGGHMGGFGGGHFENSAPAPGDGPLSL